MAFAGVSELAAFMVMFYGNTRHLELFATFMGMFGIRN
jgi:hypothetical protein